ncbi:hypothetical protein V3C99_018060, partial [Haemonchus contortus]
TTLFS